MEVFNKRIEEIGFYLEGITLDQNNGLLGSNMHVENLGRWYWMGLGWWQGNRKVIDIKLEGELMNLVSLKVGVRKETTQARLLLPTKIMRTRTCGWRLWELSWVSWIQLILRHPCEDARKPCECRLRMLRLQLVVSLIPNELCSSIGWWTDPEGPLQCIIATFPFEHVTRQIQVLVPGKPCFSDQQEALWGL